MGDTRKDAGNRNGGGIRTGPERNDDGMKIRDYAEDKAVTLCFLAMGAIIFWAAAMILKIPPSACFLLIGFFAVCTVIWLCTGFLMERKRLAGLERMIERLPEKWLLGELGYKPRTWTQKEYDRIMHTVSSAAIGAIERERREKEAYFDYVESWIHEMKTPLTACSLILSNDADAGKLRRELKRADNLTEQILFYARLRSPEKSTMIRRVSASGVMNRAVRSQMELLVAAGISVSVDGDFEVSTDDKALCFILEQLLVNCAKYCPGCHITMNAAPGEICVKDNGIGIPAYEVERVCERGFTGQNGKTGSTGMGLYIVSCLCAQLSIDLQIDSEEGKYTSVRLRFLTKA